MKLRFDAKLTTLATLSVIIAGSAAGSPAFEVLSGNIEMNNNSLNNASFISTNTPLSSGNLSNNAVDENKIASSALGSSLSGGSGTVISVAQEGVDNGSIKMNDGYTLETLSVNTALKDGNISDSITISGSGSVATSAVNDGSGSGLDADKLDGKNTSELSWNYLGVSKSDVSSSNVGLGNLQNINQNNLGGDGLYWESGTDTLNVSVDGSTLTIDSDNLKVASSGITENEVSSASIGNDEIQNTAINGTQIVQNGASNGEVLEWNGNSWSPATDNSGTDDQNLSEVLVQGSTANISINLTNNNISDVGRIGFDGNITIGNEETDSKRENSISIGRRAESDYSGVALGVNASSLGTTGSGSTGGTIAIGEGANADTALGVAIGKDTSAGNRGIALGEEVSANQYSVAIGQGAATSGKSQIAIGRCTGEGFSSSFCPGQNDATAMGEGSVAIGRQAEAPKEYTVNLGSLADYSYNLNVTGNATFYGENGVNLSGGPVRVKESNVRMNGNNITDAGFISVKNAITDGNISDSITISSSGSVATGAVSDGSGSGLNADKLDGKNTSELTWVQLGIAKSDVSSTNVGLGNLQNINQSNTAGTALTWDQTNKEFDVGGITDSEISSGAITESGSELKAAAVNSTAIKDGAVDTADLNSNAVTDSEVKDSITISGGSVDTSDLTYDSNPGFNWSDKEIADNLTLNSSATVDAAAIESGLTDSQVNDALTLSSSGQITLASTSTPTTEGRLEWDGTNDRINIGDGDGGTAVFYRGPHTTDTNASTECTGSNYLTGDGNCNSDLDTHIDVNDSSTNTVASDITGLSFTASNDAALTVSSSGTGANVNIETSVGKADVNLGNLQNINQSNTAGTALTWDQNNQDFDVSGITSSELSGRSITANKIKSGAVNGTHIGVSGTNGDILGYDGSKWTATTDQDTTYSAGDGIGLSSQTFTLLGDGTGSVSCSSNNVPEFDGSSWGCSSKYDSSDDGDSDSTNELLDVRNNGATVDSATSTLNFTDSDFSSNNPVSGISEIQIGTNAINAGEINSAAVTNTKIKNSAVNGTQIGVSASNGDIMEYDGSKWTSASDENTQLDDESPTSNVNMAGNNMTNTDSVQMNDATGLSGGDSCSAGDEGEIVYNGTHHLGCQNGNTWKALY